MLVRFSWFGFIIVSIIGDNIQYLSFRCFSQLYQLLPLGKTQFATILTAYVTLFLVVFYSASAYIMLPIIIEKNSKLFFEGFRKGLKMQKYFICTCLLKICMGYVHSVLCSDGLAQIMCLLLIQVFQLVLLIDCHSAYLSKCLLTFHIIESIFRTILHLLLLIELYGGTLLIENINTFEDLTGNFINYIFVMCIADILISNFMSVREESSSKPFIHKFHKSINQSKTNELMLPKQEKVRKFD